jgi:lysophospholipase L1-like esterase
MQKAFPGVFFVLLLAGVLQACAGGPPASQAAAWQDNPRILIYGDSITWGYVPLEDPSPVQRFPFSVRWPGVIQTALGNRYIIVEEGLNSRTAGVDEFASYLDPSIQDDFTLNGRPTLLPLIRSHEPLALVVIMLGTNDTRLYQNQSPEAIEASVTHLIQIVKLGSTPEYLPKILLVAPPPGRQGASAVINFLFEGSYDRAALLGRSFAKVARAEDVYFFDAGTVLPVADGLDGIHLTPEGNAALGKALAEKISGILE